MFFFDIKFGRETREFVGTSMLLRVVSEAENSEIDAPDRKFYFYTDSRFCEQPIMDEDALNKLTELICDDKKSA